MPKKTGKNGGSDCRFLAASQRMCVFCMKNHVLQHGFALLFLIWLSVQNFPAESFMTLLGNFVRTSGMGGLPALLGESKGGSPSRSAHGLIAGLSMQEGRYAQEIDPAGHCQMMQM